MPINPSDINQFLNAAYFGEKNIIINILNRVDSEILKMRDQGGANALFYAAQEGHTEIVRELLNYRDEKDSPIINVNCITNCVTNKGSNPLFTACSLEDKDKNFQIAKMLIDAGADVNKALNDDTTPLYICAQVGATKTLELLLKNGANKEKSPEGACTPLTIAIKQNNNECVKLLLDYEANANVQTKNSRSTPLMMAVEGSNFELVKRLVDDGVDLSLKNANDKTALDIANSNNCSVEIINYLKEAEEKQNEKKNQSQEEKIYSELQPIHYAAQAKNIAGIKRICEKEKDPVTLKQVVNSKIENGVTPIHFATQEGLTENVSLLLDYGADPNIKTFQETTALYLAAQYDHCETARVLLKKKALVDDPSITSESSPLYIACQEGHHRTAAVLIKYHANVNARFNGATPLHIAAQLGHLKCVELLINHGADINAKTYNSKRTPLHMAIQSGSDSIVKYLLDNGADPDEKLQGNFTAYSLATELKKDSITKILNEYKKKPLNEKQKAKLKEKFNSIRTLTRDKKDQYVDIFSTNEIDVSSLPDIDKELLISVNITNQDHIDAILKAFTKNSEPGLNNNKNQETKVSDLKSAFFSNNKLNNNNNSHSNTQPPHHSVYNPKQH